VDLAGRHAERLLGKHRGFVLRPVDHVPNAPLVRRRSSTSRGSLARIIQEGFVKNPDLPDKQSVSPAAGRYVVAGGHRAV
jgi:hypothetical protein